MWKQDSGENLKSITVQRKQASLGSESKEKKPSLGNQGQAFWLWTSQEEKDSEQKLKSKVGQKSFEGAETQNLQHLMTRQIFDDLQNFDSTVNTERLKASDQSFKGYLDSQNQNMNKQSYIKRSIAKDSDSTPNKKNNKGQSSSNNSQDVNQKKSAHKVQALQQKKQSKLVAKVDNISSISIEQQEAQD